MNRFIIVLFMFSFVSSAFGVTLEDEVKHTLCTNPIVKAAESDQETAFHAWKAAKGGYFPQVTVTGDYGRERSSNPSVKAFQISSITLTRQESRITLSQLIFDGGAVSGSVAEKWFEFISTRFKLQNVRESVAMQTVDAYVNVLRNRQLVKLAEENLQNNDDIKKKVVAKVSGGAARRVEESLAMSRLSKAQTQLITVKGELSKVETHYLRVIGHRAPQFMVSPKSSKKLMPETVRDGLQAASLYNPELQSAKADLLVAQSRIKVSKSRFWPKLNLQLTASENRDLTGIEGTYRDASALLQFDYGLFHGGSDWDAFKAAQSNLSHAMQVVQNSERQIGESLRTSWDEIITKRNEAERLRSYVTYTLKVVQDYKTEFDLGQRQLFNVLDAQNDLFIARSSLTNSEMDSIISYYRILQAVGGLTFAIYAPSLPEPIVQPCIPAPVFSLRLPPPVMPKPQLQLPEPALPSPYL
jgi:adhesin transport system outer membrane protein